MLANRSPGTNLVLRCRPRPFVFRLEPPLLPIATSRPQAPRVALIPLTARMILSDKSATSVDGFEERPLHERDDPAAPPDRPRALDDGRGPAKLFLWQKARTGAPARGTVLFVHGSSMASTPGFDLQAPGYVSAMDFFAAQGFDCWCCDHRGYGRSYEGREFLATIAQGADDLAAASQYIRAERHRAALCLRHLLGRTARRAVCGAPSGAGQAAGARCLRVDRQGQPDAGAAAPRSSPNGKPARAVRSTAPSSTASIGATTSIRPIRRWPSPMRKRCSPSTIRSRTGPISTCARTCRSTIRPGSRCRSRDPPYA